VDGKCFVANFKEANGKFEMLNQPYVVRVQKRTSGRSALFGQVNTVDIGHQNNGIFYIVGGSEDLAMFN
jgi:hypothetical protein